MCVSSFLMWKILTPTCPCFPNMSAMFTELAWVVLNSKPKQKSRSSVLFVLVCLPETCDDVTWFGFRFSSDFQESPDAEDYELGWTFNLEFVFFFFLLEMLKMFTSSVITSLGIVPLRRYVYLFLVLLFLNLPMSSCLRDFIAQTIRQFAMQIYCHIVDPFF